MEAPSEDIITGLPDEIQLEILDYLDMDNLQEASLVCLK